MAHFAELDPDGTVVRVLVVPDEQEHRGQEFLADDLKLGGTWVKTSYTGAYGKNYAGIGYRYDTKRGAFIAKKPSASWILNEETCQWEPPEPRPKGNGKWEWSQARNSWVRAKG